MSMSDTLNVSEERFVLMPLAMNTGSESRRILSYARTTSRRLFPPAVAWLYAITSAATRILAIDIYSSVPSLREEDGARCSRTPSRRHACPAILRSSIYRKSITSQYYFRGSACRFWRRSRKSNASAHDARRLISAATSAISLVALMRTTVLPDFTIYFL